MTVPESAARPLKVVSLPRVILGLFGLVAVVLLGAILVLPGIIEGRIIQFVQDQIGIAPTIEEVRFDPVHARVTIEGFELQDPIDQESLFSFDQLVVDVQLIGFLNADLVLDEVVLKAPRVLAEVDEAGDLNFVRLMAEASSNRSSDEKQPPDPGEVDEVLIVDAEAIRIEGGDLRFRDRSQTPIFETRVAPFAG